MKLHWSPRSPFVRKVMITAHELGLADRIRAHHGHLEVDSPPGGGTRLEARLPCG